MSGYGGSYICLISVGNGSHEWVYNSSLGGSCGQGSKFVFGARCVVLKFTLAWSMGNYKDVTQP